MHLISRQNIFNMKKTILIMMLAIACTMTGHAQSTNPLNYSGRMYIEAIDIFQTPRYVSYEDHAILSRQMRMPTTEVAKFEMDFEKGTIIIDTQVMKVKVNATKKYATNEGWVVVLYMDDDEKDKYELIWPEYGKPYYQQIVKTDKGISLVRMILSSKPYAATEEEALRELLQGLGNF